ncbi:MAG: 4-(cytidine 5'-diphospho)-2-C-methyl-D-erythritol kinase [Verrucomicrobia bacterium]|nr:4-(cytidine 5'-diphospho)-2-C-methyl-D-erythritol kinase [Verrucomicrobiota bacterium]MBS0646622.1 4-(cytidine 5'-diphospho)-2-C-methyl-D-erythritol kinase [Verrucomicrobiota bacterium]
MLTLFSPAKINLFLRVLGRRDDGYHELATLMQAVDLGDTLILKPSLHDFFSCTDPSLECDPRNLVVRALELFRTRTGRRHPLHVTLCKRIPMQAGLGGGSSNAATMLWGLNQLYHTQIPIGVLQQWGAELGADVPFFFSTGTAYCRGKGERVEDYPPLPFSKFWLYKPVTGLSTKLIFQSLDLKTCSSHAPNDLLESCYTPRPVFHNDLESVAIGLNSELSKLKQQLIPYFSSLWMTGSGTSLIGLDQQQGAPEGKLLKPCCRAPAQWYLASNTREEEAVEEEVVVADL